MHSALTQINNFKYEISNMKKIFNKILNILTIKKTQANKETGATMIEYALMVALIAVVATTAVTTLGSTVSNKFTTINTSLG